MISRTDIPVDILGHSRDERAPFQNRMNMIQS